MKKQKKIASSLICLCVLNNIVSTTIVAAEGIDNINTYNNEQVLENENESKENSNNGSVLITDILLIGNKKIDEKQFKSLIKEKIVNDKYNENTVKKAVQQLIDSGLFKAIKTKPMTSNGDMYLVFDVKENDSIKDVLLKGNTLINREEILINIEMQPQDIYNKNVIKQDSEKINKLYKDKGFSGYLKNATIDEKGNLVYDIVENKVSRIDIHGNKKSKNWVIEKVISKHLKSGDYLQVNNIKEALNSLQKLGFFKDIKAEIKEGNKIGEVVVEINLVEAQTGEWSVGGGYNTHNGATFMGSIKDKNFNGEAKELAISTSISPKSKLFDINYKDNFYQKSDTSVSFNAFKSKEEEKSLTSTYDESRTGLSVLIEKPIAKDSLYKFFYGLSSNNVKADNVVGEKVAGNTTNSINVGIVSDTRNNITNPTQGSYLIAKIQSAIKQLGSDVSFNKLEIEAKHFKSLDNKNVLGVRGLVQLGQGDLPLVEKFRVGGSSTLRGVEENSMYGDKAVVANIELRHLINDSLQAVVFTDYGTTWVNDHKESSFSYGIGARIQTGMGLLRIDLAKEKNGSTKTILGLNHMF